MFGQWPVRSPAPLLRAIAWPICRRPELDRGFPITLGELVALGDWRNFGQSRAPPPLAASVHERSRPLA